MISSNWKTITTNAAMYGLASAVLFAGIFPLLCISGTLTSNVILGAISGIFSGVLISIMVGMFDQMLIRKEITTGVVTGSGANVIFGALTGAFITTGIVISMIQLVGIVSNSQVPIVFGVPLCLLIGIPLGIMIGLLIGASWRSR